MPRRNRVDPMGDLHAVEARGMFTGNRGCLVNDRRELVRHHNGSLWIICEPDFRGWKHELDAPRRWTPLFFLDEAVALAAGHRPCAFCRPEAYRSYRQAVIDGTSARDGDGARWSAADINRQLATERHAPSRGIERAVARRLWTAALSSLPTGAMAVWDDSPHLVQDRHLRPFTFGGWGPPTDRIDAATVQVITPPLSTTALRHGFEPALHPTASTPLLRR